MKRIDRNTVQRILDTADIVDVVSDFVTLKRRGTNWVGLCPFHDDRSPSFYVSRTKGICKCFSCGKSASAVGFVMEHENMTYNEALRYLAKKYGIEIEEHEMTDSEREEANAREALFAVNQFALSHFVDNLHNTEDGRNIGMSYFRQRGLSDKMIERFQLGYAIDKPDVLFKAAHAAGYTDQALVDSGLCIHTERGTYYDRFKGRVIFPVFTVSGRVVAFGGRTLSSDKKVAKYVNSPESLVYSKSHELYGLYQAKNAISKHDKCILVEGYLDVISMHQAGVENVVASSGTSLTQGQIRLIHRFTDNVTVIYDSDAAGIKASLRGINLLLADGLNIKVVSLPDGDDPDSFAQSHSSAEVEQYIKEHEVDFIRFKTDILLKDAGSDPIERAKVISSIVESISVIPNMVTRTVYLQECARRLDISEKVLSLQVAKAIGDNAQKRSNIPNTSNEESAAVVDDKAQQPRKQRESFISDSSKFSNRIAQHEQAILRYVLRYGMISFGDMDGEEDIPTFTVVDYIENELAADGIGFSSPIVAKIFADVRSTIDAHWQTDLEAFCGKLESDMKAMKDKGMEQIRAEAKSLADIEQKEQILQEQLANERVRRTTEFKAHYLESLFISDPDDKVRNLSTTLISDRYQLSKYHSRYAHVETEIERLGELVPRALHELKLTIIDQRLAACREAIGKASGNDEIMNLMKEIQHLNELRGRFAHALGERTVTP